MKPDTGTWIVRLNVMKIVTARVILEPESASTAHGVISGRGVIYLVSSDPVWHATVSMASVRCVNLATGEMTARSLVTMTVNAAVHLLASARTTVWMLV